MMRLLLWAGAALWAAVVWFGVFYVTFPSTAVAGRIASEVGDASRGRWTLSLGGTAPWWTGLSATQVIARQGEEADGTAFFLDEAGVRVGPWSLLRRKPKVDAYVRLGDGRVDVSARLDLADGPVALRALTATADGIPLDEVVALLGGEGASLTGGGTLTGDVELGLGKGLSEANGSVRLTGDGLRIASITLASYGITDLELDAAIDTFELHVGGEDGDFEIHKGEIRSTLIDVEITGRIELADRFDSSRADIQLVVRLGDWAGTPLEPFATLVRSGLASAAWSDGTFHYTASGPISRIGSLLRPDRERSSAPSGRGSRYGVPSTPDGAGVPAAGGSEPAVPSIRQPPDRSNLPDLSTLRRPEGATQRPEPRKEEEELGYVEEEEEEEGEGEELKEEELEDEEF